jgi:hypothetical protein
LDSVPTDADARRPLREEITLARATRAFIHLVLVSALLLGPSSALKADSGAVRLRERAGAYQITVFTSPTPFRQGPVDVSVLVQDDVTGEPVPEARVTVYLRVPGTGPILEYSATTETATNKLFRAAEFQLPESGWWDMAVVVEGPHGPVQVRFGLQADEPLPRWLDLWPWFSWPALVVALFGVHRVLVRKKAPPGSNNAGAACVRPAGFVGRHGLTKGFPAS